MKSLYDQAGENTVLGEEAKERITKNVLNKIDVKKSKRPTIDKIFKLTAVCASAAIVCGMALTTGLYFGSNSSGVEDEGTHNEVPMSEEIDCYNIAYEMSDDEYDLDNFHVTLYYSIDEENMKKHYENLKIFSEMYDTGDIVSYSFNVRCCTGSYRTQRGIFLAEGADEDALDVSFVVDSVDMTDFYNFPFEDYKMTEVIECDSDGNEYVSERSYAYSIDVSIPKELLSGKYGKIYFAAYDLVEFERRFAGGGPNKFGFYDENYPDNHYSEEEYIKRFGLKLAIQLQTMYHFITHMTYKECAFLYDINGNSVILSDNYSWNYYEHDGEIKRTDVIFGQSYYLSTDEESGESRMIYSEKDNPFGDEWIFNSSRTFNYNQYAPIIREDVELVSKDDVELAGREDVEIAGREDVEIAGKDDVELAGKEDVELTGRDDVELAGKDDVEIIY